MNTYILLAVLTLTAWWASGGSPLQLREQGWLGWMLGIGLIGILFIGATGAIAALGNTLFPTNSLTEGFQQDFSPTAHFLIRLRVSHPVLAIFLGAYIILIMNIFNIYRATFRTIWIARIFMGFYVIQLIGGALNIVLLAPVWMQLFHLFVSDLILVIFILFIASACASTALHQQAVQPNSTTGKKVFS